MRRTRLVLGVAALVVSSLVAASCGAPPEPDDFTVDNATGFRVACADPVDDSALVNAVCRCIFEQTSAAYTFDEFQDLDATLKANPEAELPADIQTMIAACIIEESDLELSS